MDSKMTTIPMAAIDIHDSSLVRCQMCKVALDGEAIVLEEKFLHPQCFRCSRCANTLHVQYVHCNGKYFCTKCFHDKVDLVCYDCKLPLVGTHKVRLLEHDYHPPCAKCRACKKRSLIEPGSKFYYKCDNEPHCLSCASMKISFGGLH